jgi:hypothetical protein
MKVVSDVVVGNAVVMLTVRVIISGTAKRVVALELPSTLTTENCALRASSGLRCSTLSGKASVEEMSETRLRTESTDGDIINYSVDSKKFSSIEFESGARSTATTEDEKLD